jgi:hypothetical protein
MLIALVLFNIVHPGRIMSGKESDIPGRKERKLAGIGSKVPMEETRPLEMV